MSVQKRSKCCLAKLVDRATPVCSDCKEHCDVFEFDDEGAVDDVAIIENQTGSMAIKISVPFDGTAAHDPAKAKP